jgi:NAD(P)H-hydrate epimerase
LLDSDSAAIQNNRLAAVVGLQRKYQTTVLLKGAGSLVANNEELAVCPYGNAHMASGGMGDVLSGMIGAFIAQGLSLMDALELAVVLHAKAGDVFAKEEGGLGLVASDILTFARRLMNDKV